MPISTTIRRLDNGICINADGLVTDDSGTPTGANAGYTSGQPTQSAPFGSMRFDPATESLWIQKTQPAGNTWRQLIAWIFALFLVIQTSMAVGVAVRWDELSTNAYSIITTQTLAYVNSDVLSNSYSLLGYGAVQFPSVWSFSHGANTNPRNGVEWWPTGWGGTNTLDPAAIPQAFIHVLRMWGGFQLDVPTMHIASKGNIRIEPMFSGFSDPLGADYFGQNYMSLGNEDSGNEIHINYLRGSVWNHLAGAGGTTANEGAYNSIKANAKGYGIPVQFRASYSKSSVEGISDPAIWGWSGDPTAADPTLGELWFQSKGPTPDIWQPTFGEQNPAGVTVFKMKTNHTEFLLGGIMTDTIGAYTNGSIAATNTLKLGINSGTSAGLAQVINNSGYVGTASGLSHFIQFYNGNTGHGMGVASFTEGTADYISSDAKIIMAQTGSPSTAQVIFDVATPTNTFKGGVYSPQFRSTTGNAPASASAAGTQGEIRWDANYIYVCTAANTWKRVAIATW